MRFNDSHKGGGVLFAPCDRDGVRVDIGWTVNFPIGELLLLDELDVGESIYIYFEVL